MKIYEEILKNIFSAIKQERNNHRNIPKYASCAEGYDFRNIAISTIIESELCDGFDNYSDKRNYAERILNDLIK